MKIYGSRYSYRFKFFIMLAEVQINLFSELDRLIQRKYECIVLSEIVNELQRLLTTSKPKKRKKVTFALQFLNQYNIKILIENLLPNETPDEYIFRIAKRSGYVVATNDRRLRQTLRKEQIPVVFLRQRSHLSLEGFVG